MKHFFIIFILGLSITSKAQLPNIEVQTSKGKNVVSWVNPYNNLYSISVQRSIDTSKNYVTIATLNKPKKGANQYIDEKPLMGKSFYQLIITFNPDVEWNSSRKGIFIDSMALAQSMAIETKDAANKAFEKAKELDPTIAIETIKPEFTFIPSTHVFTNTYSGHVNIMVENAVSKKYAVVFYNSDKKEVLRLDRISFDNIVLDKHNFNGRGTFSFVLLESGKETETGFVNIIN